MKLIPSAIPYSYHFTFDETFVAKVEFSCTLKTQEAKYNERIFDDFLEHWWQITCLDHSDVSL